jgi:hypothetical protein
VAERFKAPVLKTGVPEGYRGFESHPIRMPFFLEAALSSRMRSPVTSPSNRGFQARTSVKITKMLQRPYRYGCKLTSVLRLRGWLLPLTDLKTTAAEQKWKICK